MEGRQGDNIWYIAKTPAGTHRPEPRGEKMKLQDRSFAFYLSGLRGNDTAVQYWIHSLYAGYDTMLFKLPYTPPYKDFGSIRAFQIQSRFRPFTDTLQKEKLVVLDLSNGLVRTCSSTIWRSFFSFCTTAALFTTSSTSLQREQPVGSRQCRCAGWPAVILLPDAFTRTACSLLPRCWQVSCRPTIPCTGMQLWVWRRYLLHRKRGRPR